MPPWQLGVGLGCKFDMSFVHDMADSKEALAIIRAITDMSNSLNIKTTAEGVETPEQMDQLTAEGCTCFQGTHVNGSRGVLAVAFPEVLHLGSR